MLAGSIRRGDGQEIQAVVWYNDLRNSTALADTMPGRDYIQLLNVYFDTTAALIIKAGGEVLDFIGDGVLAIFPYHDETQQKAAIQAATGALREVIGARDALNEQRVEHGLVPLRFGIGLNTGKVMFGNIGIPERLTFSVIGPTVNEVSRIELLTKATGMDALVTREIAALDPGELDQHRRAEAGRRFGRRWSFSHWPWKGSGWLPCAEDIKRQAAAVAN